MVHEYNTLPDNARVITDYEDFQDFLTYQVEKERRSPWYNPNNHMVGMFSLRIFWIDKGLGLSIANI